MLWKTKKQKKTYSETTNTIVLNIFLFKNNHIEVRNQQAWIKKQKLKKKTDSKTKHTTLTIFPK